MNYIIDESLSDSEFTASLNVDGTFGVPRRIESITIHHWGSFGQTHDGVNDFFVNRNANTSAHFVVSDGRINCLVSPLNASWAAGNAYGNATSIHLECRPEATNGDYRTVAWLVKFLRDNYGANLPLKHHREWSATACPGIWDLARVDREARAIGKVPAKPIAAPSAAAVAPVKGQKFVPDNHWRVDKGDTLDQAAKHFGVSVDKLAKYNGIKDANKIKVGERVWPPVGADTWVVEKGDTLSKIVAWYHANGHKALTVQKLQFANGINNPATETKVGLRLQIPK
ncbi:LysM peptidoglycan-binding domain-containing protein [Arthrobacter pityocampae]|uniref:LysM peptidoglycan-binding domain-containing protein n=1 Tax=Arthrobacter pityocampae TaxID=547334 RepID=UPI003736407E